MPHGGNWSKGALYQCVIMLLSRAFKCHWLFWVISSWILSKTSCEWAYFLCMKRVWWICLRHLMARYSKCMLLNFIVTLYTRSNTMYKQNYVQQSQWLCCSIRHPISGWWSIIASCQVFASLPWWLHTIKTLISNDLHMKIFTTTCAHKSSEFLSFHCDDLCLSIDS